MRYGKINLHASTIITSVILLIITVFACIKLFPFIISLTKEENRIAFENYISNLGFKGILIVLLIQILQIFVAIIPGEIVEILAGLLYGPWGGLAICLIGNIIASTLIYLVVKFLAKNATEKLKDKLKQYSFLNNKNKIAIYLFILYLIPGIPKDIITYLVPFLPINFGTFLIITSIARIPSIVSSTYSSYSLLNNNYTIAIITIVVFTILATIGFVFKDKIMAYLKKNNEDEEISNNTSK